MKLTQLEIPRPDLTLSALGYLPDGEMKSVSIVLTHGFTASKASLDLLAGYLAWRGYPCLTYDCRGHKLGSSGGRLDDPGQAVEDLRATAAFASRYFETERCVLCGHSMGGMLSIAAADIVENAAGVCAIAVGPEPTAGFRSPAGQAMLDQRTDYVEGIEPRELLRRLGGLAASVRELAGIPSLFVAARGDVLVKADTVREFAAGAGPKAEFMEVDGSHMDAPDRGRAIVANWLARVFG